MSGREIEMKYIENIITRQVTFFKCLVGVFKKADALARLCNVEVAILIFSPAGRPYVFKSPCFEGAIKRFRNSNLRRKRYLSSLKQARIVQSQAELARVKKESERNKERGKVLKKMLQETFEKYNMKEIEYSNFEELAVFKKKLEAIRDYLKNNFKEIDASSSLLMLSKNERKI